MADVLSVLLAAAGPLRESLGASPQPDLLEARQMQALSLGVHIPIVCFGIAFPAMVLFVEGLYLRTGDPTYKALAKRWSKVALLLFAVGVVTGTILSFEFGLLWPEFMASFGEVFGLAFGLEGISFFLEAIFIAIYVYGWDRLPKRTHFLCGIPIIITGFTGSLFVIGVNGWMNNPQGFDVVNGEVVNPRPWEALFNEHLAHELTHMYLAGYLVAGFIVAGVYAWAWLRGRRDRYHRIGLVVPLTFAALAAPMQVVVGDWAGRAVAENQPVKLAAFEGVVETQEAAPFTIGGFFDEDEQEVKYGIEIPYLLSFLAFHDPNARVIGLDSVPEEDRPPVNVVRYAFQTMIAIGSFLALMGVIWLGTWRRRSQTTAAATPRYTATSTA
jgi:cytochrome d ubiquinol oxidase subunit I